MKKNILLFSLTAAMAMIGSSATGQENRKAAAAREEIAEARRI